MTTSSPNIGRVFEVERVEPSRIIGNAKIRRVEVVFFQFFELFDDLSR
jgi:hypothetical protein